MKIFRDLLIASAGALAHGWWQSKQDDFYHQRPADEITEEILSWLSPRDRRRVLVLRCAIGAKMEQLRITRYPPDRAAIIDRISDFLQEVQSIFSKYDFMRNALRREEVDDFLKAAGEAQATRHRAPLQ